MRHEEFEHADLRLQRAAADIPYLEFLRSETFELGLYELAAGSEDGQKPHDEDEIYVVLTGFTIGWKALCFQRCAIRSTTLIAGARMTATLTTSTVELEQAASYAAGALARRTTWPCGSFTAARRVL